MTTRDGLETAYRKSRRRQNRTIFLIESQAGRQRAADLLRQRGLDVDEEIEVYNWTAQEVFENRGVSTNPADYPTSPDLIVTSLPWHPRWGCLHQADPSKNPDGSFVNPGAVGSLFEPIGGKVMTQAGVLMDIEIGMEHYGPNGEVYELLLLLARETDPALANDDPRQYGRGFWVPLWVRLADLVPAA